MDVTIRQSIQFHRHYHQQVMNGIPAGSIRDCDQITCRRAVKNWSRQKYSLLRMLKNALDKWEAFRDSDLRQVIINPDGHTVVVGFSYRRTLRLIEAAENARWLHEVRVLGKQKEEDDAARDAARSVDVRVLPEQPGD